MARKVSGNKIVIEGSEQGSVFPATREDCFRELLIDGRKKPFDLDEGAFSLQIKVQGSGAIRGPIYGGSSLYFENNGKKGSQCIMAGATAREMISTVVPGEKGLKGSVVATDRDPLFVFRGDVVAGSRISLRDTCVIGTVRAPEVELVNSVVLGMVDAENGIRVACSVIGMYATKRIRFEGPVATYCEGGVSRDQPEFGPYQDNRSVLGFGLRFLPFCRVSGWGCGVGNDEVATEGSTARGLGCAEWMNGTCEYTSKVELLPLDFVQMDASGLKTGWGSAWFLTLQGRAMNMTTVYDANQRFEEVLQGIAAYEHLTPENQSRQRSSWTEFTAKEQRIFQLSTEGPEDEETA